MTRSRYDRYCDPKLLGAFIAPELGSINPQLQDRIKTWRSYKDEFLVEFTGTYSLTEVQLLLREYELRDYPKDVSSLRKLPKGKIKSDVIRFWYNLELHYQLPYPQLLSKQEVWRRAFDEGADFANWLDDLFCYAYRNAYGEDFIPPEEFEGIRLENYSSVFPPCFLPRIEEETFDMRKWMVDAPTYNERIRREVLHEVEKIVRNCERLYIPHFEDIIASIKDTVCYYHGVKYKPYELQLHQHCEISSDYVGYETKVLVYPSGMRDTVILEKASSNMIRVCEKIFLSIIDSCEESIYGLNGDRLRESLNFFSEQEEGYHVLRDIKKCGLTVPVSIYIDDIQKILEKYFPEGPWHALDIYKNIKIKLIDGTWLTPKRGAGLGMANNLTTLLCIAVHRLAKRYFYKHKTRDIYITGRIGNDDSDVYVRGSIEDARDYLLFERDVLSDAGFVVNLKKTYISRYYHLFEEYQHENFKYKESLAVGMLTRALLEKNMRTAKYMAVEAQKLAPTINVYGIIESIALARRYEFDSNELNRPFWLGGWIYKRLDGKYLGLDSLGTALLYSRKEVYRAARIIQDFHRLITSLGDHQILSPHDNANYVWRRAGYVGNAVKGAKGFYNYSLSENYKHMTTMWKIKNIPTYKFKVLSSLYRKNYELDFSGIEFATFCVKSGNFYNDISLSRKYITLYETPTRNYQIPLRVPFKASEAAYVSKRLAGILESLPKCISEINYASEYYPIFQYDSVITDLDPQGKRNYLRYQGLISGDEKIIEPFDVIDECTQVEEILGRFNIILYPTRKEWLFERYVSNAYAYLMKDGIRQDDDLVIEREEFSNYWSFLQSSSDTSQLEDSSDIQEEFWHIVNGGAPEDLVRRLKTPDNSDVSVLFEKGSSCSEESYSEESDSAKSKGFWRNLDICLNPDISGAEDISEVTCEFYEEQSESSNAGFNNEDIESAYDEDTSEESGYPVDEDPSETLEDEEVSYGEDRSKDDLSNLIRIDFDTTEIMDMQEISEISQHKDDMPESETSGISYASRQGSISLLDLYSGCSDSFSNEEDDCFRLLTPSETEEISIYDRDRDPRMCPVIMESALDTSDTWVWLIRRKIRFFLMSREKMRKLLEEDARRIDEEFGLNKSSEEIVMGSIFQADSESYPFVDERHLRMCLNSFENFSKGRSEVMIKEFATNVNEIWLEKTYGRKTLVPVNLELLTKVREKLLELKVIEISEEMSPMSFEVSWLRENSSSC